MDTLTYKPWFTAVRCCVLFAVVLMSACQSAPTSAPPPVTESQLRATLGIPAKARVVLVINQSSHLDIDWLLTMDQYYRMVVRNVLFESLSFVENDPGAHYAVAEMGFVRRFWNDLGEKDRSRLLDAVQTGRWQIVGGGISSPDENLPLGEALVRDWGHGNRWARETLGTSARYAWDPDSFGHSAFTPSILRHLGLAGIGFARLPGEPFVTNRKMMAIKRMLTGQDGDIPGSIADRFRRNGIQAFRWRAPDGSETLGMWMPRTYCEGDDIDTVFSMFNFPPSGQPSDRVDPMERISSYLKELRPFAKPGYIFLPVGCDFTSPHPQLPEYVERWNRERYPDTGVWLIQNTFATYGDLVRYHWKDLPVETLDLNPVWTGFYGTRPALKGEHRILTGLLQDVEAMRVLTGSTARDPTVEELWWLVGKGDHHDWIPGTAVDAVYRNEQLADYAVALPQAAKLLAATARDAGTVTDSSALLVFAGGAGSRQPVPLSWSFQAAPVDTHSFQLQIAGAIEKAYCTPSTRHPDGSWQAGDCKTFARDLTGPGWYNARPQPAPQAAPFPVSFSILNATGTTTAVEAATQITVYGPRQQLTWTHDNDWSLRDWRYDGIELLARDPGNLALVRDDGGLYRLGAETMGCRWQTDTTSLVGSPRIGITSAADGVHVNLVWQGKASVRFDWWIRPDATVSLAVETSLPEGTTALFSLHTRDHGNTVTTAVPYGVLERPRTHIFTPSFWPVAGWVDSGSLAALSNELAAWRLGKNGTLQAIVARNTTSEERCDLLGAAGTDPGPISSNILFVPHPGRDWQTANIAAMGSALHRPPRVFPGLSIPRPVHLAVSGNYLPVSLEPLGNTAALRLWSPGGGGQATVHGLNLPYRLSEATPHLAYGGVDTAAAVTSTANGIRVTSPYGLVELRLTPDIKP